jgi:hypothetical protein
MFTHRTPNSENQHRIDVIMGDGTQHHVTPKVLDVLLESNRITKFKRSSGWVTVGVDPIRATSRNHGNGSAYLGPERRLAY